jgi:single-strand DNA-binding protein
MVNEVIYQGRLTKDPELKSTQSGISTLLFNVAWSNKYKDVETKCFLLCRAWRQTAEFISTYFKKGQEIIIVGHLETQKWDDDKEVTLCMVDRAHFAGSKATTIMDDNTKPSPDEFMDIPDNVDEELPFK